MNIAFLSSEFPHETLPPAGGIGSYIKNLSKELILLNHKVIILLVNSTEDKVWETQDGIKIIQIKSAKNRIEAYLYRFILSKKIKRIVKQYEIDVIESQDWEGYHAFLKLSIPIITRIHGSVTYFNYLEQKRTSFLLKYFEKRAILNSTKVIAVSKFAGITTQEVFNFRHLKFDVIYNGIDIEKFKSIVLTENEQKSILYFGTLARKKGVLEIPVIFNKIYENDNTVKLILIGKDSIDFQKNISTWKIMQTQFSQKALTNVIYKQSVPYEQMQYEIEQATICVFPSYAEAFPISWLEAMSMEKALVTSDIGWASEALVDNESAFLVYPKEHDKFVAKIQLFLNDKNLRLKFGKSARQRVEKKFDNKELIYENINFYKSLLNEN